MLLMGKLTISMAIFNSFLLVYQYIPWNSPMISIPTVVSRRPDARGLNPPGCGLRSAQRLSGDPNRDMEPSMGVAPNHGH